MEASAGVDVCEGQAISTEQDRHESMPPPHRSYSPMTISRSPSSPLMSSNRYLAYPSCHSPQLYDMQVRKKAHICSFEARYGVRRLAWRPSSSSRHFLAV